MSGTSGALTRRCTTPYRAGTPRSERCILCQQSVGASYYRVKSEMACCACVEQMIRERELQLDETARPAFVRAVFSGIAGAFVGSVVSAVAYYMVPSLGSAAKYLLILTWVVVPALVVSGIGLGSGNRGGRRYQILAVGLTYLAFAMAPVAMLWARDQSLAGMQQRMNESARDRELAARRQVQTRSQPPGSEQKPAFPNDRNQQQPREQTSSRGMFLAGLLLASLVSPFLISGNLAYGLFKLMGVFVGMAAAWKVMGAMPEYPSRKDILGPFPD